MFFDTFIARWAVCSFQCSQHVINPVSEAIRQVTGTVSAY
jgi:hypothetical protein